MTPYYYTKEKKRNIRNFLRLLAAIIAFSGMITTTYIFFPLISWRIYFAPVFAQSDVAIPIPKTTIVDQTTIKSLINQASDTVGINYTNAENWFPTFNPASGLKKNPKINSYSLTIPKLTIKNAIVSTTDYDLGIHLVQYGGTATPPENGNTVIFGHSTLPQLFNPNDYKTIFANAYKLGIGDEIFATIGNISYSYRINSITVVDPTNTSIFSQEVDGPYLTLVTCTPPGTTWKRLIIKARFEKI